MLPHRSGQRGRLGDRVLLDVLALDAGLLSIELVPSRLQPLLGTLQSLLVQLGALALLLQTGVLVLGPLALCPAVGALAVNCRVA